MEVLIYDFIRIILPLLILWCLILIGILIINRYKYDLFKPKFDATKNKIENFLTTMIFSPFDETLYIMEIEQFKKAIPIEKNCCKKLLLNEIIFF
ncbi:hypothetical protein CLU82_0569 [Flavobacterium sp. 5]|nr:hypothetical protein CLU82_0569 [Flavobacterium sp. 5]